VPPLVPAFPAAAAPPAPAPAVPDALDPAAPVDPAAPPLPPLPPPPLGGFVKEQEELLVHTAPSDAHLQSAVLVHHPSMPAGCVPAALHVCVGAV
jgi:hypothetical protein